MPQKLLFRRVDLVTALFDAIISFGTTRKDSSLRLVLFGLVFAEVILASIFFAAMLTLEFPGPEVSVDVSLEMVGSGELLGTNGALVLHWCCFTVSSVRFLCWGTCLK